MVIGSMKYDPRLFDGMDNYTLRSMIKNIWVQQGLLKLPLEDEKPTTIIDNNWESI